MTALTISKTTSWRYRSGSRKTKKYGLIKGYVRKPCYVVPCPPFRDVYLEIV